MIKDIVSQENLKLSNAVSTARGFVATHKNVMGGLSPVTLKVNGKYEQNDTPTPDAPVDIVGAGESGSLSVKTCKKNVLALSSSTVSKSSNTTFSNGTISMNLSADIDSYAIFATATKKVLANTQYTLSYMCSGLGESDIVRLDHIVGKTSVGKITLKNGKNEVPFTVSGAVTDGRFVLDDMVRQSTSTINLYDFQIEEGTATDYEPYTETTADIPLSAPLYDGDYICYNMDGTGELVRENYEYIVDRNSYTVKMGYLNNYAEVHLPFNGVGSGNYAVEENAHSTHFVGGIRNSIYGGTASDGIALSSDGSFALIRIDGYTTLDEYNAWFDSANCKIVYKLAEPIITELTTEQITAIEGLLSQDGLTNVMSEGMVESGYFANNTDGLAVLALLKEVKREEIPVTVVGTSGLSTTRAYRYGKQITLYIRDTTTDSLSDGDVLYCVPEEYGVSSKLKTVYGFIQAGSDGANIQPISIGSADDAKITFEGTQLLGGIAIYGILTWEIA